ncbi:MAG TPA: glycerophosphodiester phosphodiesterase family protein [Mycobacteriales bacterium]|nr:glycerophosphodiester phosphodiesterase family protein [Mycobacteriales bacterium]
MELTDRVVAAHRGAGRLAPENTVAAFEAALAKGAVALELDVQLTSNDELAVIHDSTLDRTTNGRGLVRSLNSDEVAALDAGSWFAPECAGEWVPTLEQILELSTGRARLNIELKDSRTDRVAERVIETVRRFDAVDRVVVMSFDLDAVLAAKRRAPSFVVLPIVSQPLPDPLGFVQATGLDGLNCPPRLWPADLIQAFRDQKLVVHGSLINDAAELRGFFDLGGQTADSDDPELFGCAGG